VLVCNDINEVREYYATLRKLIILNPGGWDDTQSRARVEQYCQAGMVALDDNECQERLKAVQNQARELYSRDGHQRWTRRSMSGADYLRLQILITLEALHTRLSLLESLRKIRSPTLEKEDTPGPER
jgi:hypothetical protein